MRINYLFTSFLLLTTLSACVINVDLNNIPPVAVAGRDQDASVDQLIQLDGSASTDEEGDPLSYHWAFSEKPDNSSSNLSDVNSIDPVFSPDLPGKYVLALIVNDGQIDSDSDTLIVIVNDKNTAPIADAGGDLNLNAEQTVQLNGVSSSDANGDNLSYLWSITNQPDGSTSSLSSPTIVNPTFRPDADGTYVLQLIVSDGELDSAPVTITVKITGTTLNVAPVANAGPDQNVITNQVVQLDASASSDPNNNPLTYRWSLTTQPDASLATLDSTSISNPIFVPDVDGTYTLSLRVNDSELDSESDSITITSSTNTISDNFSGSGPLIGYTTNNPDSLPDVVRVDGRYRANLVNNDDNKTLHFYSRQGRLDAKLVAFPFEYIARNIGIGTQEDSQQPPSGSNQPYIFAGIQVHVPELESRNSSHLVVGHRGGTIFTVEGKNTLNGRSAVSDAGYNVASNGRADLRIVGNSDRTLTAYWQLPNLSGNSGEDNWTLYRNNGEFASRPPTYDDSVYIGLITYAEGNRGIPFVGTCDAIEFTPL